MTFYCYLEDTRDYCIQQADASAELREQWVRFANILQKTLNRCTIERAVSIVE